MMTIQSANHWFLRLPFAAVFLYHGAGKLLAPSMSASMLELSVPLVLLVGLAELLAGLGAVLGGVRSLPYNDVVTRLTGLAAAPVLLGAIALVHAPRWSFVPTESHPMGGMEFQVVLLGLAVYFMLVGAPQAASEPDRLRTRLAA
jgi:putative oxidoreductase